MGEHSRMPDSRWDLLWQITQNPMKAQTARTKIEYWCRLGTLVALIVTTLALGTYGVVQTWL